MRAHLLTLSIFLMTLFAGLNSFAQMKKPDFAFPKTVEKDALADLRAAEKNADAHAALNALIRAYLANKLIEGETQQSSIELAELTAEKFRDSDLHGIFLALETVMYTDAYTYNRYKFDSRKTPMLPVPKDITEWNGKQFKQKIAELAKASYSNPKALSALPISYYKDIISADKLTAIYYPTLLDFAYQNAISVIQQANASDALPCADICALGIENSSKEAAKILWEYRLMQNNGDYSAKAFEKAKALYGDSEFFSLILDFYASHLSLNGNASLAPIYDEDDIDDEDLIADPADEDATTIGQIRDAVATIDAFCSKFPTTPFRDNLLNQRERLLLPSLSTSAPEYVAMGKPFKATVKSQNAQKALLNIYTTTDKEALTGSSDYVQTKTLRLFKSIPVAFDAVAPFQESKEVEISLPDAQPYVIVAIPEGAALKSNYRTIKSICAWPTVVLSGNQGYVQVSDPATGEPMPNVEVLLSKRQRNNAAAPLSIGFTDKKGTVNLNVSDNGSYTILLKIKGKTHYYGDLSFWTSPWKEKDRTSYQASVLTDRSIYHPGDTVHVLAVLSKTTSPCIGNSSAEIVEGQKAKLTFYNTNHQMVDTITAETDEFGRIATSFVAPTEGLTGTFTIVAEASIKNNSGSFLGSAQVTVSDYKMPDFYIELDTPARNTPQKGDVTISGKTITYSGAPLANAEISAQVKNCPFWFWWRTSNFPFFSKQTATDSEGNFSIIVPDSVLSEVKNANLFLLTVDAVSPSGSTAEASTPFSQGERYGIQIQNLANKNIDGEKPFAPVVSVIGPNGNEASIPLEWTLAKVNDKNAIVVQGPLNGAIDLSQIDPDNYIFTVKPAEKGLADPERIQICIYNYSSKKAPASTPLWILTQAVATDAESATIEYATTFDEAYVYYTLCGTEFTPLNMEKVSAGYHKLEVKAPFGLAPGKLQLFIVKNCQVYTQQIEFTNRKARNLTLEGESFRDKLIPGDTENWTIHIKNPDGSPAQCGVVLDMFNKALSAIQPHTIGISSYLPYNMRPLAFSSLPHYMMSNNFSAELNRHNSVWLGTPSFNFYGMGSGLFFETGSGQERFRLRQTGSIMMSKSMAPANAVEEYAAVMADGIAESEAESEGNAPEQENASDADFRSDDVPLAFWEPQLSTDSQGNVCYSFTVPNANTTWQLQAVAWTRAMDTGALQHDFIASKPIMVMPNAPRFLRTGDECEISTIILNATDSACVADAVAEIFNPLNGEILERFQYYVDVDAKGSATISTPVRSIPSLPALGFRVKASNGSFSDGEQSSIRILPSEAEVIETTPFYLNPGDSSFTTILPSQPGARISLTFCENPVWTIVSALPGLRENAGSTANSAAAAIFSASIAKGIMRDNPALENTLKEWLANPSESALTSMLQKNEDLKIALLNATPWVQNAQSDTERMARLALIFDADANKKALSQALQALQKLQNPDGGWRWGSWCNESSEWTTSNILAMMAELKENGWLPQNTQLNEMLENAIRYYDGCQKKALESAKNKESVTDEIFTIVRPQYPEVQLPAAATKVIANTINYISANWKKMENPAIKAMAAEALYRNKYANLSKKLMESISQFGVWTPDQGLRFPSVNSLSAYAVILNSYALIAPQSKEVDGIRQQLIVRKQGTDWGSAVVTSEVVTSILNSGSRWTVPAQGAKIYVGNQAIAPNSPMEKATGSISANLSEYPGKELRIETPAAGPAYGAVYAQFSQKMDSVKAASCPDLSIEKTLTVRRGTEWEYVTEPLQVGDRVKVQLTIHCKRNLQYVAIIDERPAAFQPVNQVPGWLYSEGVGFYRENRDAATNLYVNYISPGTYILTYEMNVGIAGSFSSGIATIQSQYAPELSAHSAGASLSVQPK